MDNKPVTDSLLKPFRVLDITDDKGCFCAKLLGDLGAEVIRLEKPGTKRDFWWWAYNTNKKLVHIDIEKEPERVLELAREADFVIEGQIIIELKAVSAISAAHEAQAHHYLAATGLKLAVILNFGAESLQQKRIVR